MIAPPRAGGFDWLLLSLAVVPALAALWLLLRRPGLQASARGIEAFELGTALAEKGDPTGAEAAFRHADDRGHPSAPASLGMLRERRGDLDGAEAAYRRGDERGDATAAFRLGVLLERRHDRSGAEAAYVRAYERGRSYVKDLAQAALAVLRARG